MSDIKFLKEYFASLKELLNNENYLEDPVFLTIMVMKDGLKRQ